MGTYLGQNFLIDAKVRHYIADHVLKLYQDLGCETLIEIGPGKGAITKLIHQISKNFFVIEKDTTLKLPLNEILNSPLDCHTSFAMTKGQILWGDVLDVDVEKILKEKNLNSKKTLVVGNLPYYITSPILRKFFADPRFPHFVRNDKGSIRNDKGFICNDDSGHFAGGIFMVQDEVAQRLSSEVKKKSYLRWLLNYAYDVKYLKGVPAKCFKPAPKVKSALITLNVKCETVNVKFEKLIQFLDLYSLFTRKTLGKIEKMIDKNGGKLIKVDKSGGKNFTIPESLRKKRLEELRWEEMGEILNSPKGLK